jgi:hypothetical protein
MNKDSTQATGKIKPCHRPNRKPGVFGAAETPVEAWCAQAARRRNGTKKKPLHHAARGPPPLEIEGRKRE